MSVTARGRRASATSVSEPGARLPAPSRTWITNMAICYGGGLLGAGILPMAGFPELSVPALVAGGAAGSASILSGIEQRRRAIKRDRLVEALAGPLGNTKLDRRWVKLREWSSLRRGQPRRVEVSYAPGCPDTDPQWQTRIKELVAARLDGGRYEVHQLRRDRCLLVLRRIDEIVKTEEQRDRNEARARAEKAITDLIGATTRIEAVNFDADGKICSIDATHQNGARIAAPGYRRRIEGVVSTMLPGRWRAIWDLEQDTVHFEVRPTLPKSVWLPLDVLEFDAAMLQQYRKVEVPYAIDEDGRRVCWRPAISPHLLITGGTGTGKTSTMRGIIGEVSAWGWPVWIGDPKRVEYLDMRRWPNVQVVAGRIEQQVALVHRAWELMERRYELVEAGQAAPNDFEPLLVVLDEYAEFRANLLAWYSSIKCKGEPAKPPALGEVASLARKGRTARIHLVLGLQRPDAEFLGGEMRDNFAERASLGRLSPQGAQMMWENPATGVSLPRGCTGRAIATHDDGVPVEVQAFRFPDMDASLETEEGKLLVALRDKVQAVHPRLVIVPPTPDVDATGEPVALSYWSYATSEWDLAENRPDLDLVGRQPSSDVDRRLLSSPLASLGLVDGIGVVPKRSGWSAGGGDDAGEVTDTAEATGVDSEGEEDGYLEPVELPGSALAVGDLIEIEDGVWAVVDEDPSQDPLDPGMVVVSWRSDDDDAGNLCLPADELLRTRKPNEEMG